MRIETDLPMQGPNGTLELHKVPELAKMIEDVGFDGIMMAETKHDPFIPLALSAPSTRQVTLATAVAIAFPRSPMVVANTAWDLQRLSGGRFILGLGPQVKAHNEKRFSVPWTPPGPRMREYILSLRAIWDSWQNGSRLNFKGDHYNFSLMTPVFNPGPIANPHIPIHLAAVNDYNCRLAGEVCDGVRLHPIATPKYLADVMMPQIEAGAAKAGRSVKDVEIVASALIAMGGNDEELAASVKAVRARIAFYASTRTYKPVLDAHGWGHVVDNLHALSVQGRWDDMSNEITDEMLETIGVVGTFDTIVGKLKQRFEGVADVIRFSVPTLDTVGIERLKAMLEDFHR